MAGKAETSKPVTRATSLAVELGLAKSCLHAKMILSSFTSGKNNFIIIEFMINPKYWISVTGSSWDFSLLIRKPNSSKICVMADTVVVSYIHQKNLQSTKYRQCRNLKWAMIGLKILVNTRGAKLCPNGKQVNSNSLDCQRNRRYFLCGWKIGTLK